jgi:glyoxylase-like metal-dependent hydrolase (beta-lactamase superfamily II)
MFAGSNSRISFSLRCLTFAVSLVLFCGSALAQGDFDDVKIEVTELGGGIHMLKGAGGNLGVCVGDDGVFLIDDQYAPLSERIMAAIRELSDQPVKCVFNTHWHGDHTGGNENFGATGSLLVSHANVRRRMSTEQFSAFRDRTTPPSPDGALPVVTFTDSVSFFFNDEEIVVFHVPAAHTDGDGVIHFTKANIIHSGDIIFYGLYPYIDVSAGGSINGVIEGMRTILAMCDENTKIIPGHGPLLEYGQLESYLAMLVDVRDAVALEIKNGKDLAGVQAAAPAAAYDADWGQAWLTSDQFVQEVFDSLTGK